jgi:hypothetical protein
VRCRAQNCTKSCHIAETVFKIVQFDHAGAGELNSFVGHRVRMRAARMQGRPGATRWSYT